MPSKTPIRLAILISGGGSNLQAIIDRIANRQLNAHIAIVISDQPAAYGLVRSASANIASLTLPKKPKEQRAEYDKRLASALHPRHVDLIVLAGFMRILSAAFVTTYKGKIINLHPSLLPAYKGLNTHARVLQAKEQFHGASVHFVTPDLDQGPLILQKKTAVQSNDTPKSLQQRVRRIEHQILPSAIALIAEGTITGLTATQRTSVQQINSLTSYL